MNHYSSAMTAPIRRINMENQDQYLQKLDALLSNNPEAKHLYDMLVGAMVGDDDFRYG